MNATPDVADDPVTRTDFGAVLKHWRKQAGLSQAQLAARLGYHHSVISRWETGGRQPPLNRIRRIDGILATGGQLAQLFAGTLDGKQVELPGLGPDSPLPGGPIGTVPGVVAWEPSGWPTGLPHHDVACPLHGVQGCAIPPADQAPAIYVAFTEDPSAHTDSDTIHVLAAQLAVYSRITEEIGPAGVYAAVEAALHLIASSLRSATGPNGQAMLHLAASYASLAGQLRMLRGQHGSAMALLGKGLQWATLCDDMALRATLMCDMSSLVRLENDGVSAVAYAQALPVIGPQRTWISALSHLYQARGHAVLGDLRETTRNVALARDHLDRLTTHDEQEATWIAGVRGKVLIESGIGGALRDVAAATAERGIADAARTATERSLAFVPTHMRPATVLLALRLADCYACAGQPEAAVAIATPVLPEAMTTLLTTITQELCGLRNRLAARWPNRITVRDFLERGLF